MSPPAATASECEDCGAPAKRGSLFCGSCGARFTTLTAGPEMTSQAAPVPPPYTTPQARSRETAPPRRPPLARTQPRRIPPRPAAAPQPAVAPAPQPAVAPAPQLWYPPVMPAAQDRPAAPALLVTIAVFLVFAFAGAAVAIILAVTSADTVTPAPAGQTTITVITHAK